MSETNTGLKLFVEKLKKIDVAELLEKAKTINIEDIRSLKWDDIKKFKNSKALFPLAGIISATFITILALKPSIVAISNYRKTSQIYKQESLNLKELKSLLTNSLQLKKDVKGQLNDISSEVVSKNKLIYISSILDESAIKSNVSLIEISPQSKKDIEKCSIFQDGMYQRNSRNLDKGLLGESLKTDFPKDSMLKNIPNEYIKSDPNFLNKDIVKINTKPLINIFRNRPPLLSKKFRSNYYSISIEAEYINVINFLRSIQEYKVAIIPICFQSTNIKSNINNKLPSIMPGSSSVDARLFINIPTR